MSKGYATTILFLFAIVRFSFSNNSNCDYVCDNNGCNAPTNSTDNDVSSIKFCSNEDVPIDVDFSITEFKDEDATFPALLWINLKPPKKSCKYDITLLSNEFINKKKCMHYNFPNVNGIETHSKASVCFTSNQKQDRNTTEISFPYIFTACYSVQFFLGKDLKMIKSNKYLETGYKRTEIAKPIFECTYEIVPATLRNRGQVVLEMSFSVSIVTDVMIYMGSLHNHNLDGQEICFISTENLTYGYQRFNVLDNLLQDKYSDFNRTLIKDGWYKKHWKLSIDNTVPQNEKYCFLISFYHDARCRENTLWRPPVKRCTWYQSCHNITFNTHFAIETNISPNSYYSYFPITIITLSIFGIIGLVYFVYFLHTCKTQGSKFYKNIWNRNMIKNQSKNNKTNLDALQGNQTIDYKDVGVVNSDIILVYPKGPESFMAMMADFRGTISRICGCVIHDWYDGMVWNYVAEIGPSDWFAKMLSKGCRVIWIDAPVMRSLISQGLEKSAFVKNSEEDSFVKIGDFRDVGIGAVFNLSKRYVDKSTLHQSRHFVVQLNGYVHSENDSDPFFYLSSHKRYYIPQDLTVLCSDLSVPESNVITSFTSQDKDRMKQHSQYLKSQTCK